MIIIYIMVVITGGMTPLNNDSESAFVSGVTYSGAIGLSSVKSNTIRPVISLKASAITAGTGTASDPFVVG